MPSEIKKIALPTDCMEAENFFPNFCNGSLGIGLERCRSRFSLLDLSGKTLESLTIHLPTRGQWKGIKKDLGGRNHVSGQVISQEMTKILRSHGHLRPRHDITDQS